MKNTIGFVFLLMINIVFSQEQKDFGLELSTSYGMASDIFGNEKRFLGTPKYGSILNFDIDFALSKNRFIGIGFTRQLHSKNLNKRTDLSSISNSMVIFDNFRLSRQKNFYDVHFRKEFQNHLHLTFGLFYFQTYLNTLRFDFDGTNEFYILTNEKQRPDNFGLSLSLDYFFPIKKYIEIGVRGKVFYTLDGAETLSFSPILKVSF